MSQLLTQFFASVQEFNTCKTKGDYQNLKRYYHRDAKVYEVDPPHGQHGVGEIPGTDGNQAIVRLLGQHATAAFASIVAFFTDDHRNSELRYFNRCFA
jgi:hypothetical protein